MKWIAALLMVVNVMIFLGVSDRQVELALQPADSQPDVNRDSMLLLKEVQKTPTPEEKAEDSSLAVSAAETDNLALITQGANGQSQIVGVNSQGQGSTNPEEASAESAEPEVQSTAGPETAEIAALNPEPADNVVPDMSCYRVGPFKQEVDWEAARAWVEGQNYEHKQVRSESRELRAVRIYIGPFESIGAAQQDVEILKQKELDHFIYLRDGNQARISLGYFTQEELAIKYVEYLNLQDIRAKSQPEYRTLGPFDWIDLTVESSERNLILKRDWGSQGIEINERSCEN